jgi:protein-S-isoprenylcysteine O-methyltransferase Ste14
VTRLPGDPGPAGWLRFAFGFRLPARNEHWVRHELTDAGWRWRTVVRHLVVILPVCAILVAVLAEFLPAPLWVSAMMVVLILSGSVLTVATYADDIRAARLRQHGLPVPSDPDLGRPTH